MEMTKPPVKDLGWANEWYNGIPDVVTKCRDANHEVAEENVGNCATRYRCDICGYKYMVDSSG